MLFRSIIDKAEKERFGETEEAKAGNADGAASAAGGKTAGNAGGASKTGNAAAADSKNTSTGSSAAGYRVLAVTACPQANIDVQKELLEKKVAELDKLKKQQIEQLEAISGMSGEQAKEKLITVPLRAVT